MRTRIEDLPLVRVSTLVANGYIRRDAGVRSADLRRLLWANPKLTDAAAEIEERRLDLAEKNIYEALRSDDSRRRGDAASMFTIRNSHRARRRGWITTSTGAAELSVRDEGKRVVSIGWGDGGKTIEQEAAPAFE